MLKTIARITLILLLAGLISGALYLLVNSPVQLKNSQSSVGDGGEHLSTGDSAEHGVEGTDFTGRRGGGRHFADHDGQGSHGFDPEIGLFGALQNIGVIALITLGVIGLQKLFRLVLKKRKSPPSCEINPL